MTQKTSVQLRFVQGTKRSRSMNINLPSYFCEKLGICPGDLLAIQVSDEGGLVFDKVRVVPENKN